MNRQARSSAVVVTWIVSQALWTGAVHAKEAAAPPRRPSVEVVFVLDTTGSMGGLLEGAKQKVWSIANEIAKGRPAPSIKMGLIAYRDRGDSYVTQVTDLTSNLDKMYKELLALSAGGGGDGPEHVLKALEDAVDRVSWSRDAGTFRVVYLVGDAPPHEEYKDTPSLEALLQKAMRKGLVVNAVQCGTWAETTANWQKIARLGEGKFMAIAQDGGMAAVATPFDERIGDLSRRLDKTALAYGRRRTEARAELALSARIGAMAPASAAADRAAFRAKKGFDEDMDLVAAAEKNEAVLEQVKHDELPAELKGLSRDEMKRKVRQASKERQSLQAELKGLNEERARYIAEHGKSSRDSFDAKLVDSLKEQAARKGIAY